ncbi:MAG TPA: hypothetical protein VFJ52_04565 [Terriglobia bacterium]|nr:hypothetical protein [Terriglobia bacterium]
MSGLNNVALGPIPPVGEIRIMVMADGNVRAQCVGLSRNQLLMALEAAKVDFLRHLERQQQSGLDLPPPGMQVERT